MSLEDDFDPIGASGLHQGRCYLGLATGNLKNPFKCLCCLAALMAFEVNQPQQIVSPPVIAMALACMLQLLDKPIVADSSSPPENQSPVVGRRQVLRFEAQSLLQELLRFLWATQVQ
jgi:hypothetical protein